MNEKETIDQLIHQINLNPKNNAHKDFIFYFEKADYDNALLKGCQLCMPWDNKLTKALEILISYKRELRLNLNVQNNSNKAKKTPGCGTTPIAYAAKNNHYALYFLLQHAEAESQEEIHEQMIARLKATTENVLRYQKTEFISEHEFLQHIIRSNSDQKLNEDEKKVKDKKSLFIIQRLMKHLITYYSDLNDPSNMIDGTLLGYEKELLCNRNKASFRRHLVTLSELIGNLSKDIRDKYSEYLKPLSWHTLQQLGSIFALPTRSQDNFLFQHLEEENIKSGNLLWTILLPEELVDTEGEIARLRQERCDNDLMIDAATTRVTKELPILFKFITEISQGNQEITPCKLPIITAVTRYFNETSYLIELINVISEIIQEPDVSTKLKKHIFLRRMQNIGEWLTGKNTRFYILDKTFDVQIFVSLRDYITHQDQNDNKRITDELLQNDALLNNLIKTDLPELLKMITRLITTRRQSYGDYRQCFMSEYWDTVINVELKRKERIESRVSPTNQIRRVDQKTENRFILLLEQAVSYELFQDAFFSPECQTNFLANNLNCVDIKSFINTFRDIFNGTAPFPLAKTQGALLRPLSAIKRDNNGNGRKLYLELNTIFPAAIMTKNQPTTKVTTQPDVSPLPNVIALIKKYQDASVGEPCLTPIQRIDAAIEALTNIIELLEPLGYSYNEWSICSFTQELMINKTLRYAIEYNAGQLLQHLHLIREHFEANKCTYLSTGYETIRSLRNIIEHGDSSARVHGEEVFLGIPNIAARAKKVAPELLRLTFALLPELQQLREKQLEPVSADKPATSALLTHSIFSDVKVRAPELAENHSLLGLNER